MPKKSTIRSLKKYADRIFSELVRRSACDGEYCQCITCGEYDHWKNMQAGHFIGRQYNATRYDRRNVNVQCPKCNCWDEGRKYDYGKWLIDLYGEDITDVLRELSHTSKRFTITELKEMIAEMKQELKGL
jgi:hypothetical protein